MRTRLSGNRGQTSVLFAFGAVAMVGALALGADVANMYFNWQRLQTALDSAALAGASYLPEDPDAAKDTAVSFAEKNGLAASEITTPTVDSTDTELTVSATRTVPYYFGRVLGLTSQVLKVTATAAVPAPSSCVNCAELTGSSPSNGNNGCGQTIGDSPLMPAGLDNTTDYTQNMTVTLTNNEAVGPGNWGLLALCAQGGNAIRTNLANGYLGTMQIGDWIPTKPGQTTGPMMQGFSDRVSTGASSYPSATAALHTYDDPRVMYMPMVDWSTAQGRSAVKVTGFAAVWLNSVNGTSLSVTFISGVAPGGLPNNSAPYAGVRGTPKLTK